MMRRAILCGVLALSLVGVGFAGAASAANFQGKTGQKRVVRIAGNAKSVDFKRFKIALKCRNGTILVVDESGFLRTPLRKGGRFKDRQFGKTDTVWFRGQRRGKVIRGQIRVTDKLGSGVRCNSGWVKFRARMQNKNRR